MKQLPTITDRIVFKNPQFADHEEYTKRVTVKAIVKNSEDKFAFITSDRHGMYLLPGGGADSDNLTQEISRECMEEINYSITNISELATISELRNREAKEYSTVCFIADAQDKIEGDFRTESEKVNNIRVEWFDREEVSSILEKQIKVLDSGNFDFYNIAFNVVRDHMFWNEYLGSN